MVEGWFGGIKYDRVPAAAELHESHLDLIEVNAAVNSQVRLLRLGLSVSVTTRPEVLLLLDWCNVNAGLL